MLKFSANISTLFTELPFRSRFAAASMAGFDAVECQFPYALTPGAILAELEANRLRLVLLNAPPGNWEEGERGLAALPGRQREFEQAMGQAFAYAEALDCRLIHVMAGVLPATSDPDRAMDIYVENLAQAAEEARRRQITLLIEPINRRDMPGYFVSRTETARRAIDAVASPHLRLQFDIYHRQMTEGNVTHGLREHWDIIRHIQIANPPDRRGPDEGELNFEHIFGEIRALGYDGHIGCEYSPHGCSRASLEWFQQHRPVRAKETSPTQVESA
ncbi:hydroxypyruvate isomerase family protein [Lutibaculum baratangense]|uniref:Hydroxypyruvate isomerase n=1 Tax=Lutibaculum baratangense AMV1 TaxID=631454 RepID=V4RTQ9_9HYPH|nr:TIM barrel protein [Lutibaculum baratangense]ESR26465.1 Hydroxypyruvate isomerase [Lutibaculum baratangense AMV1]